MDFRQRTEMRKLQSIEQFVFFAVRVIKSGGVRCENTENVLGNQEIGQQVLWKDAAFETII